MGYYHFPLEKRNVCNFASSCKYIIMSKPNKPTPENGKKKVTAEQNKEYREKSKNMRNVLLHLNMVM